MKEALAQIHQFRNKISSLTKPLDGGLVEQSHYGKATFLVTLSKVIFSDSVVFYGNNGTSLHLSAGIASFNNNTDAKNYGIKGGAITLMASSYLEVGENSYFNFTSNHAFIKGGAIYSYSIGEHELHDHILSLGCFIQHKFGNRNSNFIFINNQMIGTSNNYGQSIFSTSLLACASDCHGDFSVLNASTALSCVRKFYFH